MHGCRIQTSERLSKGTRSWGKLGETKGPAVWRRSEGSTLGSITDSISYVISTFRPLYQIVIDHTLEFGQN